MCSQMMIKEGSVVAVSPGLFRTAFFAAQVTAVRAFLCA
jgi:hypothetical protein